MGLYLKCPGCHAKNPLYEKICSQCGQSLENIPRGQRVYVIEPGAAAPAQPAAAAVVKKAPTPGPAKAPPKPKGARKKKA